MKYAKPQIATLSGSAVIRGGLKTSSMQTDSNPAPFWTTVGAYEADE